MSNRSNRHSQARAPLAPKPLVGRHARRVARKKARSLTGMLICDEVDKLRRLLRPVLAALQTRHGQ